MFNSTSFSSASFSPVSWAGLETASGPVHEVTLGGRVYVRKKHKIYTFDSQEQAEAFFRDLEAVEKPKTRKQRQRATKRLSVEFQPEVIDLGRIERSISHFNLPYAIPSVWSQPDWREFVRILQVLRDMEDEVEVEMLLFA